MTREELDAIPYSKMTWEQLQQCAHWEEKNIAAQIEAMRRINESLAMLISITRGLTPYI